MSLAGGGTLNFAECLTLPSKLLFSLAIAASKRRGGFAFLVREGRGLCCKVRPLQSVPSHPARDTPGGAATLGGGVQSVLRCVLAAKTTEGSGPGKVQFSTLQREKARGRGLGPGRRGRTRRGQFSEPFLALAPPPPPWDSRSSASPQISIT